MSEEAFLRSMAESPYDVTVRLVYADWLEDQGDPRARDVRESCRFRLPIQPEEVRRLVVLRKVREEATGDVVDLELPDVEEALTRVDDPTASLEEDLAHLNRKGIEVNFPRTETGLIKRREIVLLSDYQSDQDSRYFLVAESAAKGPPRITVRLTSAEVDSRDRDWNSRRAWWDTRVTADPRDADMPTQRLNPLERPAWLAALPSPDAPRTERVIHCMALQDAGRFEDALALFEIEVDEKITRLLNGEVLVGESNSTQIAARGEALRRQLWESAPWNFAAAYNEWQSGGFPIGMEEVFGSIDLADFAPMDEQFLDVLLFYVPPKHVDSSHSVNLGRTDQGAFKLTVDSNHVFPALPESAWKRPIKWDLERLGSPVMKASGASRGKRTRSRNKS